MSPERFRFWFVYLFIMGAFLKSVRYAARSLAKSPGFTLIAIATLALGMGVNSAIFSVIDAVLLRPLPYPDPDRLVAFWEHNPKAPDERGGIAPASLPDYHQSHVFTGIAHSGVVGRNLTGSGTPELILGVKATYNLLDILGVRPTLGRGLRPEDDRYGAPKVVIIGHDLWQQRLGADPAAIGRTLTLDGEPHEIIGILPAGFRPPQLFTSPEPVQFVLPDCWPPKILANRGEHYDEAVARLKPGVTIAQAQREMTAIADRLAKAYPETNDDLTVSIAPLGRELVRRVRTALLVMLGAVGLVLLIACVNVANLLLARSAARRREAAIRLAMGAGRWRVMRHLLIESALLAAVGCGLGLLVGAWSRDLLVSIAPRSIPRLDTVALDWRVLGFTALLASLTVFLCGAFPAWQLSGVEPNESLKTGGRNTGGPAVLRWRSLLMAAEIAFALILLAGGGLLLRSFLRITGIDLGFQPDRVLALSLNLPRTRYPDAAQRLRFFQELEERVERLPGVRSAAFTFRFPMRGGWGSSFETPASLATDPRDRSRNADFQVSSPGYFQTLGIPILQGRAFTPQDMEGNQPIAIINQVLAKRLFPEGQAVGQRIRRVGSAAWQTIVGVVGEIHLYGQQSAVQPQIFIPAAQISLYPVQLGDFAIRTSGAPRSMVKAVEQQVWAIDPQQPITRVQTLEEVVSTSVAQRRFQAMLLVAFAGVALLLSLVGVYGVVSYAVLQRTPEIGVRLALGAQRGKILALVIRQALRPIGAGLAIGLAGALALSRLLATLLFEVAPSDPATFASAPVLLAGVALAACLVPARRATRVDPMTALRYE